MDLYVERPLPTGHIDWKKHQLNSNQRHGSKLYDNGATQLWRTTARLAFRLVPPLPPEYTARVVVHFRFPTAHSRREAANYQPTVKAITDGIVDAGVLVDDAWPRCIGQDPREIRPCNGTLEVIVQVWAAMV